MRVALYARVSSEKQAEKDLSISAQLKSLRKYSKNHDWTIYKEFVDEAESARSANRPAFQEMISYAKMKNKPFDAILIWKHSRFARNREDAIIYKSLLRKHGISVISMNEQVDDTPAGKLLEGIIEVIDEFYSLNLAQDTKRGLRENAMRGFQNGNIAVGYKAKKVMDGNNQRTKLEPDENFAPIIKRIFKMSLDNLGYKEIAKSLNNDGLKTNKGRPWSNSAVGYVLRNETYTGTLLWGKKNQCLNNSDELIRIENNHEPIIEREVFDTVQKIINNRSVKIIHPRQIKSGYLLSGLLYCGKCGAKMIGSSAKSGRFFYYACHNYLKRGKSICDMNLINKEEIESLVIERLKTNVLTEENLLELVNIVQEEIRNNQTDSGDKLKTIERQLENYKTRLGKLYSTLETGKLELDDLAPRIKELKAQIQELENKRTEVIESAKTPTNIPFDLSTLKEFVADLSDLLKKGSIIEQKGFLRSFIQKIIVSPPKLSIDYKIPLKTTKAEPLKREVLPINRIGSPGRI